MIRGAREGFSMVEVLVAMVLLAVILTTLAGFTFATARRALTVTDSSTREALLLATVNRYSALPFDSLLTRCDTVGIERNRYGRCAVVVQGNGRATVTVTVTPLQRGVAATQARLERAAPPADDSALCTSGDCSP